VGGIHLRVVGKFVGQTADRAVLVDTQVVRVISTEQIRAARGVEKQ